MERQDALPYVLSYWKVLPTVEVGINQGSQNTTQVILTHSGLALKPTIIAFSVPYERPSSGGALFNPQSCQVRSDSFV